MRTLLPFVKVDFSICHTDLIEILKSFDMRQIHVWHQKLVTLNSICQKFIS